MRRALRSTLVPYTTLFRSELVSESPKNMGRALNRIVDNASASYSVAYAPTNSVRDGKRRRIRVQVSDGVEKREGKVVDRKSTRLNSSHLVISYAVFCSKKK